MKPKFVFVCLFAFPLTAQLIDNPRAIPHTSANPPVVFINGFQLDCSTSSFAKDFGIADQVLQTNSRVSLFFNTCSSPSDASIETLGNAFGSYLGNLTYDDGQPVTSVDVIGYSMGGLILRSYLSGKQNQQGVFTPPATVPIHKAIFIATPNFGTPVGALAFGVSTQATELTSGSRFLMDLNTWNQNHDDLRGIDVIAIAGNGGTGLAVSPGFDDGLMALSSASLRFYKPGVTRILPLCHTAGGIPNEVFLCLPNAKGIARILSPADDNARIIASFLNGASDWQNIGADADQKASLKNGSGVIVRARNAFDQLLTPSSITAGRKLNMNNEIGWTDLIASGAINVAVSDGVQSFTQTVNVVPGGAQAIIAKPGPSMAIVIPAAAIVSPLVVAPRMIIAIYGSNLDQASVTVNNESLAILYDSSGQINAVLPEDLPTGLTTLQLLNASGAQTINLYVEPAYPAVFTLGNNSAAAVDVGTGKVVTATSPLIPGDYLSLYLTGLGKSTNATVTIAGQNCSVSYAGPAPGFNGLDQINCLVPATLTPQTAPVIVTTGTRSSPVTTLLIGRAP